MPRKHSKNIKHKKITGANFLFQDADSVVVVDFDGDKNTTINLKTVIYYSHQIKMVRIDGQGRGDNDPQT